MTRALPPPGSASAVAPPGARAARFPPRRVTAAMAAAAEGAGPGGGGGGAGAAEEPVVSLAEVLAENEELEKEARAVLGGSDHERCSYSQVRAGPGAGPPSLLTPPSRCRPPITALCPRRAR